MMGYNHAVSGALVGVLTWPAIPAGGAPAASTWVLAVAGASLLPDLDTPSSTAARTWGAVTGAIAALIGKVAGGHRRGTHDLVIAPAVVFGAALFSAAVPASYFLVLALSIGLAVQVLGLAGFGKVGTGANILVSFGVSWWLTFHTPTFLDSLLLAAALALGVVVHILGDLVTKGGVPIPIMWMTGNRRRLSLNLFTVNDPIERWFVAPALSLATGLVILLQVDVSALGDLYGQIEQVVAGRLLS